mgnify:CR=1 FL=1
MKIEAMTTCASALRDREGGWGYYQHHKVLEKRQAWWRLKLHCMWNIAIVMITFSWMNMCNNPNLNGERGVFIPCEREYNLANGASPWWGLYSSLDSFMIYFVMKSIIKPSTRDVFHLLCHNHGPTYISHVTMQMANIGRFWAVGEWVSIAFCGVTFFVWMLREERIESFIFLWTT